MYQGQHQQGVPMQQMGYVGPEGHSQQPPGYQGPGGYQGNQPYMQPPPMPGRTPGVGSLQVDRGRNTRDTTDTDSQGRFGDSFSEKAIRHNFIKKVFLILTVQLAVTAGIVCLFLFYKPAGEWVRRNSWFYWASYAVFIVTYIALVCCPKVRRKYPANFICLAIFTLAFSYITGTITSYYNTESVLIAVGVTTFLCFALAIFATQTKIDFTMCTGLIFAASIVLLVSGIVMIIVWQLVGSSYILRCVYGSIAGLIFSLFLVFDIQMIMGGRGNELSPEEYIYGALNLYLDVVYIFLMILGCSQN